MTQTIKSFLLSPALVLAVLSCSFASCARSFLEENLALAGKDWRTHPEDEDAVIWYGRRLGYMGYYEAAVQVYTGALESLPQSYKLLRHRGHRYITLRRFDEAIADLERAADLIRGVPDEVEPDGAPNPAGIPRSTSHTNIYYHLALAHYLKGEFEAAVPEWRACLEFCRNDDMLCATTHWLYMTLQRLGRPDEAEATLAPIREDMEILENHAYHRALLLYRGLLTPDQVWSAEKEAGIDSASAGYAVGNWRLYHGEVDGARAVFEMIVARTPPAAFGHIAAEVELQRMP